MKEILAEINRVSAEIFRLARECSTKRPDSEGYRVASAICRNKVEYRRGLIKAVRLLGLRVSEQLDHTFNIEGLTDENGL